MTQTAALAKHLLSGKTVSILSAFELFGMTNCPREISRQIEKKFGVIVNREFCSFTSRYGHKGTYVKYKLNKTKNNSEGIKKMYEYIKKHWKRCV